MSDAAPPPRGEQIEIDDAEKLALMRLQVLEHARHELDIWLPSLEQAAFGSTAELEQLRRIAISGRRARIRLLLGDPAGAARSAHRLLALAQRLPSVLQARNPVEESDLAYAAAVVLNDSGGLLFLPEALRVRAVAPVCMMAPRRRRCGSFSSRSGTAPRAPRSGKGWTSK